MCARQKVFRHVTIASSILKGPVADQLEAIQVPPCRQCSSWIQDYPPGSPQGWTSNGKSSSTRLSEAKINCIEVCSQTPIDTRFTIHLSGYTSDMYLDVPNPDGVVPGASGLGNLNTCLASPAIVHLHRHLQLFQPPRHGQPCCE